MEHEMKKSPIPKARPRSPLAPKKSPIPPSREEGKAGAALSRFMRGAAQREGEDMKTFGKPVQKKAKGGMCRGMGAATKGGNYKG
jgi:hypothetical protein